MPETVSRKAMNFFEGPARDLLYALNRLRLLLLVSIAAAVMAATIGILWYLLSFVVESDLLSFIFKPLLIFMPFIAAMVGALMAFDFSKLDKISFRLQKHKQAENPDTSLQPERVRSA